jgi:hypothetical protein
LGKEKASAGNVKVAGKSSTQYRQTSKEAWENIAQENAFI